MLSIIIPSIRKVPNHLIEASIRSAMERSREVVSEIVLVDNSGMSTSWPEAESASSNDLRVRIVRTATRLCMADNWNFAIAQAKNQHGILLHDDDRLTSMFDDIGNDVSSIESFRVYPYILASRRMRLRVNFSNSFHKAGRDSIFYRTPKLCSTIFNFNAVQTAGGWQAKDGFFLDYAHFLRMNASAPCTVGRQIIGEYWIHGGNSVMLDRNKNYGDHVPEIIKDLYALYPDAKSRAWITKHISDFCYGRVSIDHKLSRWVSRIFSGSLV